MSTPQPPNDSPGNLSAWLPPEGELDLFGAYGYARNLLRHAESWGPHLIGAMVAAGVLEAEGDPLEALEALIHGYKNREPQRDPLREILE